MVARRQSRKTRARGAIERRGNSLRVKVYAGVDPITGKRVYLTDSTTDEKEAERILNKFRAQVDEQRHAQTRGTLRQAFTEWLKVHEVEATTRRSYEDYLRLYVGPALGDEQISKITARTLEQFYAELRRCSVRCSGQPFIEHRVEGEHECRTVQHRRAPGRPPAKGYKPHNCERTGCKVIECQQHVCTPLSNSMVLKIHFVLSAVFSASVRWEWVSSNPAKVAKKPRQTEPQPEPPSAEEAAQIVTEAWNRDEQWGTLVWLVMVTGVRRGELLALRWSDFGLPKGYVAIRRTIVRANGRLIEKDTKTHRMRRISLDPTTVELLNEHRDRYEELMQRLRSRAKKSALLFSYHPEFERPCDPDGVTHRYDRMCNSVEIDSHLHALRHYSATELLTAGVDLRTVAGRLGHAGGGATTLRVYAAWVSESDRRAAEILGSRLNRPKPKSQNTD